MFKSDSNNRGIADTNNIMATEITSCQVGLWTFIGNTVSGYLLNFRKKDLVLEMFADTGQEVIWMWQGFCWNFEVARYTFCMKLVEGQLACRTAISSHSSPLAKFYEEQRLRLDVNSKLMT